MVLLCPLIIFAFIFINVKGCKALTYWIDGSCGPREPGRTGSPWLTDEVVKEAISMRQLAYDGVTQQPLSRHVLYAIVTLFKRPWQHPDVQREILSKSLPVESYHAYTCFRKDL